MILLECKHLTKTFDRKTVLDDVSLKIEPGKIYGLLGKNGAGKTTLIKLINDLLTPDSGKITFKKKGIGVNSKAHISYLPERTYLDKRISVRQAIKMFEDFYADFDCERAYRLLEDLDLDARHQARQPDDPQHGGTVDNKGADRIKLAAEIEMLFGMYAVEDEKADRRVQQHDHVVDIGHQLTADMENQCENRPDQKQDQPHAVSGLEGGMLFDLVADHQKRAPEKGHDQRDIRGDQQQGHIAQQENDDIAASEQRGVQHGGLESLHHNPPSGFR